VAAIVPQPASARALTESRKMHIRRSMDTRAAAAFPVYETRIHSAGQVWAAVTNFGLIGTEDVARALDKDLLPLRIPYTPSFEWPAGTRNDYLYAGGLWIGGIVGSDTLVSITIDGESFSGPAEYAGVDTVHESSSLRASPYFSNRAYADQEYWALVTDTVLGGTLDELDSRPHIPLPIEISQTSYAWSDRFSRQFIIVECWIRNIGSRPISKLAAAIYIDADVWNKDTEDGLTAARDDISGFLTGAPGLALPSTRDSLNIAWVADNDGEPLGGTYPLFSPRGIVGLRILRAFPHERFSFNWWLIGGTTTQNWGPSKVGQRTSASGGGLGAPNGDRNRYYVMTNGEVDYGQMFAAEDFTAQGWRPPLRGSNGCDIADGLDTRQVTSVGPSCQPLFPGDSMPFVFALIGGTNFHTNPNLRFDCLSPEVYESTVGFSDLEFAATWASWIYDSPGVDSDRDTYRGEFHIFDCDSIVSGVGYGCDTVYYTGDLGPAPGPHLEPCKVYPPPDGKEASRPDRAGPAGPSCPLPGVDMFVESAPGEIIVRWSGRNTEPVYDPLSKEPDFEGYRLYSARINSSDQYSLVASWDIEDYKRFVYDPDPPGTWRQMGNARTIPQWQALLGGRDPRDYPDPNFNTCYRDTVLDEESGLPVERFSYFAPQDYNRGNTYVENGEELQNLIQRVGDSTVIGESGEELHFGIYEARIRKLNPAVGLFVSVTAFDYGDAAINLDPLESTPGSCNEFAIPIYSAAVVDSLGLNVSVFPNPYKISYEASDGNRTTYFAQGYEAPQKRGSANFIEQDRRIWFVNLPQRATIRIYTLDGDLVRKIVHEDPGLPDSEKSGKAFTSDYSSRAYWDLVSRNTQAVVSGVYIYHVDSPQGQQVGKLVIVK